MKYVIVKSGDLGRCWSAKKHTGNCQSCEKAYKLTNRNGCPYPREIKMSLEAAEKINRINIIRKKEKDLLEEKRKLKKELNIPVAD